MQNLTSIGLEINIEYSNLVQTLSKYEDCMNRDSISRLGLECSCVKIAVNLCKKFLLDEQLSTCSAWTKQENFRRHIFQTEKWIHVGSRELQTILA